MTLQREIYETYCEILREELVCAMGCTEPIAIAYGASIVREVLGCEPEQIKSMEVGLSGNIIKNVKSVVVPATGGMQGIPAAVASGIIAGCPKKKLELLSVLTIEDILRITTFIEQCPMKIKEVDTGHIFDIQICAKTEKDEVNVRLLDAHTNVVLIEKNGHLISARELHDMEEQESALPQGNKTDRTLLRVENIVKFANEVNLDDIRDVLERQIDYNMAIAEEGLRGNYGACVGKIIHGDGSDVRQKARGMAAAGSDARMNGCEMPVCILSGSGNQGITASVPVIVYARALGVSHEQLLRALIISDLVTIHQKTGIGCLSAYCGAISAGCGCGAGITYLMGGDYEDIAHTVVNAVAILSGTICDGAKSSCAAKISMAVEAGILGGDMYRQGEKQFRSGEGIVTKGVEKTIENVGRLARIGMRDTDKEIIKIMLE